MTFDAKKGRMDELEQDNRRLRRLLDQRDTPGELRHRLRSTLGLLTGIIRRSAETPRDLASYAAHLQARLDAIARAQALADQFGEVDLRTVMADELLTYGALEGEQVSLSGPAVPLAPRAGQVMALAIHELAINAVEHGELGSSEGRLDVAWTAGQANTGLPTRFTWTETGGRTSREPARQGFGTEVLTRMLPYEFGAEAQLAFGAGGLHCTILFSDTPRSTRLDLTSITAARDDGQS